MTTSSEVTELVFKNELTEQGLADLRERFPSTLVFDMTDEKEFKLARKVRTERNKLTEAINQRRLDVTKELKDHGDSLMELVTDIYAVQIEPFEAENKRRKEIEAEEKRKLEKLLTEQRAQIGGIRQFLTDANTATSDEISGMVDAVGNIDAKDFHKELVHEAMEVIDEVKSTLADMLLKQIDAERLQEEAIEAEKKAKLAEEKLAKLAQEAEAKAETVRLETEAREKEVEEKAEAVRLETEAREQAAEKEREITERINKLRMIPMEVMGQDSSVIKNKIASISKVKIDADSFSTHAEEAGKARDTVLEQLNSMLVQVEQIEALTPAEEPAPVVEQAQAEVAVDMASEPDKTVTAIIDNGVISEVAAAPRTIWTDVGAWADKYQVSEEAKNELGTIINQYV